MNRSLSADSVRRIETELERAHSAFQSQYPGDPEGRQPVHVVYGGAHLFRANTAKRLGELALRSLDEFAPDFATFAKALHLPGAEHSSRSPAETASIEQAIENDSQRQRRDNPSAWFAHAVYGRVREKLQREAIEDFRIDFEDGYGNRTDEEEDRDADASASEVAKGMEAGGLPPFIGIRVKPLTEELRARSIRTLDIFLTSLATKTHGRLPPSFRVTLPKVSMPEEVTALTELCSKIEPILGIQPGALRMEVMIETPQAIFDHKGVATARSLVQAAAGRCLSVHFGPFDYSASRNIAETNGVLTNFACDFAREVMQVALSRTGVGFADGPTNILPIPPHRAEKGGAAITAVQAEQNREVVHHAWRLHFNNVRRSLGNGFYQGWDLHPAQLPARYAAIYSFFLENLDSASQRMRNFIDKAAQATRVGHVFDDAAMAQGLLNYFLRAISCGAIGADDVQPLTNLSVAELKTGSFVQILEGRRARGLYVMRAFCRGTGSRNGAKGPFAGKE
jgi:citrate lyase beta subunit